MAHTSREPRATLAAPGFKREFLAAFERAELLGTFGAETWYLEDSGTGPDGERPPPRFEDSGVGTPTRLVRDVLGVAGDGKEATAYCCAAAEQTGAPLALAKVYRAQQFRHFANDAVYRAGMEVRDRRAARAMAKKSKVGRLMLHRSWIAREWDALCRIHDLGADVPTPYARTADAILMEYYGDEHAPAPLLVHTRLAPRDAQRALLRLLDNVEAFLQCDRVHGDLSAYNVLWWQGRLTVIDFPQAVDAKTNPNARSLLERDIGNVCRYFQRYGLAHDAVGHARSLWSRYRRVEL